MPDYDRIRAFVASLDEPDGQARQYLEIHLDRIAKTLSLVPPPGRTGRVLELGTYMHMAPALAGVLKYPEVIGAFYGHRGNAERRQASIRGQTVFECRVDLFDAEKDEYPYPEASFDCVLACEIFEHLLHDPMRFLLECRRVLDEGGALILTTPNAASATAVARTLDMSENPQLHSKYADPRGEYADSETGHMREYTPSELDATLRAAGFDVECLFTTNAPDFLAYTWVLDLLRDLGFPTRLRGEQMYCRARKSAAAQIDRYPSFLYE
jgi:SAM-dependent methyltransferase